MNKLYKLKWLIDMVNMQDRKWDILRYGSWVYVICDMNDNQRYIKRWNLDFLIWFCEWILFI